MMEQQTDRVIDLWGFAKTLWAYKLIWLVVFVLTFGAGAAYAMTRPSMFTVSQTTVLSVPAVETEAQATQQIAALNSIADVYRSLATRSPVADAVLAKHPEIKGSLGLQETVKVGGVGLLIDLSAAGPSPRELSTLLKDVAAALATEARSTFKDNPAHLQTKLLVVGEPTIRPVSSGRTMLFAGSMLGALVLATFVAGLLAARKR